MKNILRNFCKSLEIKGKFFVMGGGVRRWEHAGAEQEETEATEMRLFSPVLVARLWALPDRAWGGRNGEAPINPAIVRGAALPINRIQEVELPSNP